MVSDHPIGINFGGAVGAPGVKGRGFVLGRRRRPEHLAARGLIEAGFNAGAAEDLQDTRRPEGGDVSRVFGEIEAHPDVTLGAEVVDLVGLEVVDEIGQLLRIGQIPIMEKETDVREMLIVIKVIDPAAVKAARAADEAVDLVSFSEEELGKIRTILARDAGN